MRKDTFERIKNQLYFALIAFTAFIAISFSYMTSVFWTTVKGTGYAIWTYLIAAPVLFSVPSETSSANYNASADLIPSAT